MKNLPVIVQAYVLPGKEDVNAQGQFMNSDRAEQYGTMLAASGDYHAVIVSIDGVSYGIPTKEA